MRTVGQTAGLRAVEVQRRARFTPMRASRIISNNISASGIVGTGVGGDGLPPIARSKLPKEPS
jgi:hypothetical protein